MKQALMSNAASNGSAETGAVTPWAGDPLQLSETQWASLCADRLFQLRPTGERQVLRAAALDMARTLRYFDPGLAAEMEHEGGMLDD